MEIFAKRERVVSSTANHNSTSMRESLHQSAIIETILTETRVRFSLRIRTNIVPGRPPDNWKKSLPYSTHLWFDPWAAGFSSQRVSGGDQRKDRRDSRRKDRLFRASPGDGWSTPPRRACRRPPRPGARDGCPRARRTAPGAFPRRSISSESCDHPKRSGIITLLICPKLSRNCSSEIERPISSARARQESR